MRAPPDAERLNAAMLNALEKISPNVFNILCLPITPTYQSSEARVAIQAALNFCTKKRAFMIVGYHQQTCQQFRRWLRARLGPPAAVIGRGKWCNPARDCTWLKY
ncbi:MAG: hypothetical protein ACI9W2_001031 [Gammaproteobacteria bacterium]|jgi:hypothetical protein